MAFSGSILFCLTSYPHRRRRFFIIIETSVAFNCPSAFRNTETSRKCGAVFMFGTR